jgi:hypothetical protein
VAPGDSGRKASVPGRARGLLLGQGCARSSTGSARELTGPQEARMGVPVGRTLNKVYWGHCGGMALMVTLWGKRALLCLLALPFINCVTLNKLLNLSVSLFVHLSSEGATFCYMIGYWGWGEGGS